MYPPLLALCCLIAANDQTFAGASVSSRSASAVKVPANWSEFHRRDMERWNRYETTIGVSNVGNLKLKWKRATGGGFSAPAVVNAVMYIGSSRPYVYALDA